MPDAITIRQAIQDSIDLWSQREAIFRSSLQNAITDLRASGAGLADQYVGRPGLDDSYTWRQHLAEIQNQLATTREYLGQARDVLARGSQDAMAKFIEQVGRAGGWVAETGAEVESFAVQHEPELATGGGAAAVAAKQAIASTIGAGEGTVTVAAAEGVAVTETAIATAEGVAVTETAVAAVEVAAVAEGTGVAATLATGGAAGAWLGPLGILVGVAIVGIALGGIYVYNHAGSQTPGPAVVAPSGTAGSSFDANSSFSVTTPSTLSSPEQSAPDASGVFIITEDTSQFSQGQPDALDPLGCAGRRVPAEMVVARTALGQITLSYPDEPNSSLGNHVGALDPEYRFEVDYPDAGSRWLEGQFVLVGGQTDIVGGKLYSGDCTFSFTGTRRH